MSVVVAHASPVLAEALRDGLAVALHEDVSVCTSHDPLTRVVRRAGVDLALVDRSLLGPDPAQTCEQLQRHDVGVLVLASAGDDLLGLLTSGVRGLVDAAEGVQGVVVAVDAVRAGLTHLPPRWLSTVLLELIVARRVEAETPAEPRATDHAAARSLSRRERQVLEVLARGGDQVDIAAELAIAPSTAKTHIARIMAKLGARSRVEAVETAVRCGLLSLESRETA